MNLTELKRIAEAATPGPWNYEEERYSARCVVGIKPRDDRWVAHALPEMNGDNNAIHIAAFNPQTALKLIEAIEVMRNALEDCAGGDLSSGEGIYKAEISKEALAKVDEILGGA